jgi:pimeloyl-ACP methyl ester carboxylesterase
VAEPLVLVHGGAHGAWCWAPTIEHLTGPHLAIDLPPKSVRGVPAPDPPPPELGTLTLDDWAASAIADIDAAGLEQLVLVGHSMGGLTIAEVSRRIPERVRHLVFVSAMVPPEGGLVFDAIPSDSRDAAAPLLAGDEGAERRPAVGLGDERLRFMFCNDMDDEQTRFVLEHTGAEVSAVFAERVSRVGIPAELPKTYVRLLRDQALSLEDQDFAIENLLDSPGGEVEVIELDTGHDVMISAPGLLAEVLDEIATRKDR